MSRTHTLFPGYVPKDFFSERNVRFILDKTVEVLKKEFVQEIRFERASVVRIMDRVVEERLESVPKMNQRVVMYLANEFRVHQLQARKHMRWEETYSATSGLYDPIGQKSHFDMMGNKSMLPGFNEPHRQGLQGQSVHFTFF